MHDSQAAIPLARLTASRVDSLYDLMDSAYDAPEIRAFSEQLGHVPIIDLNPRRRPQLKAERRSAMSLGATNRIDCVLYQRQLAATPNRTASVDAFNTFYGD